MISWLRKKKPVVVAPEIGSKWVLDSEDPFSEPFDAITVLALRNGYIQYLIPPTLRSSLRLDIFLGVYKRA